MSAWFSFSETNPIPVFFQTCNSMLLYGRHLKFWITNWNFDSVCWNEGLGGHDKYLRIVEVLSWKRWKSFCKGVEQGKVPQREFLIQGKDGLFIKQGWTKMKWEIPGDGAFPIQGNPWICQSLVLLPVPDFPLLPVIWKTDIPGPLMVERGPLVQNWPLCLWAKIQCEDGVWDKKKQ